MQGPLLSEFDGAEFTRHAVLRFDGLHAAAVELSYKARLACGEHLVLIADLEAAVLRDPLREGLWAMLAIARYRAGRQSEALGAVADCRRVLADQTGVEPGPRLRQIEAAILELELELLSRTFLALLTALHGDVADARVQFGSAESEFSSDAYATVLIGAFAAVSASLVRDPSWAIEVGERCIAVDPDSTFAFYSTAVRIVYWWGRAMSGRADRGADEIRLLLASLSTASPRSGIHVWHTLLAEVLIAAGRIDDAAAELHQAEELIRRHEECYAQPLTLLLWARVQHARSAEPDVIRATIEMARTMATHGEALLFVARADTLQESLLDSTDVP